MCYPYYSPIYPMQLEKLSLEEMSTTFVFKCLVNSVWYISQHLGQQKPFCQEHLLTLEGINIL